MVHPEAPTKIKNEEGREGGGKKRISLAAWIEKVRARRRIYLESAERKKGFMSILEDWGKEGFGNQ